MDKLKGFIIVLIIFSVVGFTVWYVYKEVDKFNKDYQAKIADRNSIKDSDFDTSKDKQELAVGKLVTIGEEKFYIIGLSDTTVRMLAKYNLDIDDATNSYKGTGLQDKNALGTIRWENIDDSYGTIAFVTDDNKNYWNSEINSYVYNEKSNLYNYIEKYVSYLNDNNQINVKGSLLSYDDILKLGCTINDYKCKKAPKWLTSSTYWIGSTDENGEILTVYHPKTGGFGVTADGSEDKYNMGIRPVIEISREDIKKFDIKDNDYEEIEKSYTSLKYISDDKYIAVIDSDNNLKLIDGDDSVIAELYKFDENNYKISEATYKNTSDRLCKLTKNGIYIFITNGLTGNDEKLYAMYYNPDNNEKSDLVMQNINGEYEDVITCK